MDARTYRAKEDWQAVERAMVSCLWPLSLNSARGGFKHIPEDALFSPPLPLPAPDVDRPSMMLGIEQRIAHHVDDMVAEWTKRTGQTMDRSPSRRSRQRWLRKTHMAGWSSLSASPST